MRSVLWLVLVLVAGPASPGFAHAVLLEVEPADGAVLTAAPAEVTLRFNEVVTPVFVRLLDATGHAVATPEPATARDTVVHLRLPDSLPRGDYIVSYRVISADSHPVGESLSFVVGSAGAGFGAARPRDEAETMWRGLALVDRAIFDAAVLLAIGGGLFGFFQPAAGRIGRGVPMAALVAALAAILGLGIEGGLAGATPLAALAAPATWRSGMATTQGASVALTLAGLFLLAVGAGRRLVLCLGAALAAAGFAVTGHVATTDPRWLTAPVLWLHVLCVAFWAGSLVPLFLLLRRDRLGAAPVVVRFGRVAVGAVALLVTAGLVMVVVQLTRVADFVDTGYGRRLAIKLLLVAALIAVAAWNRWRLTPALVRGAALAVPRLARSIALELVLLAGIVAMTATLGQATPPRALALQAQARQRLAAAASPSGYFVAVVDAGVSAFIALDPGRPGRNRLLLDLADADDAPFAARELTLSLANSALGLEPTKRVLVAERPGVYEIADLAIPASGTWTLRIAALIGDFDERIITTEVPIR